MGVSACSSAFGGETGGKLVSLMINPSTARPMTFSYPAKGPMVGAEPVAAGVVTQQASMQTLGGRPVALVPVAAREVGSRGLVALLAARMGGGIDVGPVLP